MDFGNFSNLLGPAITGVLGYSGQRKADRETRESAREAMAFTERMSNTSYQRARADLERAGYNPMLAFMKGGASTPGGANVQAQNELGVGANSAMEMRRLHQEYRKMQSDIRLQDASIKASNAQTKKTENEAHLIGLQIPKEELRNLPYAVLNEYRKGNIGVKFKKGMDADRPGDKRIVGGLVRIRKKGDN